MPLLVLSAVLEEMFVYWLFPVIPVIPCSSLSSGNGK
jgi:hypothetical protein